MVHWLELQQQTRAYVLVDAPETPRCVILGFHGYAERPAHCLEGLRKAELDSALLVAPMGQHQFYNREGKVVASWMTKFNREHQVAQILEFARSTLDQIAQQHGELPLYVFGFSQGASTAYRVAALSGRPVRHVFSLSGDLPPEVVEGLPDFPPVAVCILRGDADNVASAEAMQADRARLQAAGWPGEYREFEGGHGYETAAMRLVGDRIRRDLASI